MDADHEFEVRATVVALRVAVWRKESPTLGALHLPTEACFVEDCDFPHVGLRGRHSGFTSREGVAFALCLSGAVRPQTSST